MTSETDRTGCKSFCGYSYGELGVCEGDRCTPAGDEWRGAWAHPEERASTFSAIRTWCSPACRDAKLPPIPAAPAKPVVEVPNREAGQRYAPVYHLPHPSMTLLHRVDPDWWKVQWDGEQPGGIVRDADLGDPKRWTLLAPAPAKPAERPRSEEDLLRAQMDAAKPATAGKCSWRKLGPVHSKDVLRRHTNDGIALICGSCWDAYERAECSMPIDDEDAMLNVLRDPAIPERITAPKLASDWVWDTLPDGGR